MSFDDASRDDLQETAVDDLYQQWSDSDDLDAAATEIQPYLEDGFETARDELAEYGIELEATPKIRYDTRTEGVTYMPQRGERGPLEVGRPKDDTVKEHTLLNALVEEAVHAYHNQLAEEHYDDLAHDEESGEIYNHKLVLKVGYDEALTAPIVHDVADTEEPLDDHMERLAAHYREKDEDIGRQFEEMASFILERYDETGDLEEALDFRETMLRTGDLPF